MKALKTVLVAFLIVAMFAAASIYSGLLNFAADQPHWGLTTRLIETARERSIARASKDIRIPGDFANPTLIAAGAGEYSEMCTGCHLAPGMEETEMRTGLYPQPPNLAEQVSARVPAQQFWIIKHGLKLSGMPAWGPTHDDRIIWSMVAFLQKLPGMSPEAYHALVEAGGGHHHEMEEGEHEHPDAH